MPSTVHVVHCVDTEGPLHEPTTATFERLNAIFGLSLEPSRELLARLQTGDVDLDGLEDAVKRVVDPHLLAYNDTWDKVDAMLRRIMSDAFRERQPDSFGNGWVYNWFCVDHVEYAINPRRRDIGYLSVFDHYAQVLKEAQAGDDGLFFHFHPHNVRHEAHRCATHWWAASSTLYEILNRRVIERQWFPAANRPGFHATRPDSHWFLEQFIPFDFANQAVTGTDEDAAQFGLQDGRFGDWRRAPSTWEPYRPAPDDYQTPGTCRRWIARCLNIGTRYRLVTAQDVRQAFQEARDGRPCVLAITNHDFRDMGQDVLEFQGMLAEISSEFPEVPFQYTNAVQAMRSALDLPVQPPCELEVTIKSVDPHTAVMVVESPTPTFGPQPWLALKTVTGAYHHDNFDIDVPYHRWQYVFDAETCPLDTLEAIGVAANNAYGTTTVALVDPSTRESTHTVWNEASRRSSRGHVAS